MVQAVGNENADRPEDFVTALVNLQQACGVADWKMSDYGISADAFMFLTDNARETMGGLF